jgi:hypothetical protein
MTVQSTTPPTDPVDDLIQTDAKRTAWIATVILSVGWAGVILSIIYFFIAWWDLSQRESINFFQGLVYSLNLFAAPFFLSLVVAGLGHGLRLFALTKAAGR